MKTLALNIWVLFKLRISLAIMLCALAGIAVSPDSSVTGWQITAIALSVLLSAAAAGGFNHYAEWDLDRQMVRTQDRPFVTGYFRRGPLWLSVFFSTLVVAVVLAGFATNWIAAGYVFLGAFFYGVVYTIWLKRRSWTNIVLGGLSGSFAVLAGAAAVEPALSEVPVILAVVLFLWTPPHFWSLATVLRDQYAEANVPMLPVVIGDRRAAWVSLAHTIPLTILSLIPFAYGMGWIYLAGAALGGIYFVAKSVELVRNPGPEAASSAFRASLIQLTLLLLAAMADGWLT